MPRLAVLFVLSAASSPCPDLNLIYYKTIQTVLPRLTCFVTVIIK
ncbi:hypothetical protein NEIMUCOT_05320 [Neisseria mucosa ATCC 25996]|uniref:Uncharacterized protein n=1 Tax=Neisseria mucosa (strain ATCC 25996 / DSM 4631 / NCTC 10774 / M26) TaxID=546266 RepID=D2ZXG7_NEIM2|nr:hypothetical protein NEIMUCOT_05320 [Neisseria mucosa ATCC 25996]